MYICKSCWSIHPLPLRGTLPIFRCENINKAAPFDLVQRLYKRYRNLYFLKCVLGAIAFALSLQISPSLSPNSGLLVSSTLVVVLVTTLLFGGLMSIFTKIIGLKEETPNPSNIDYSNLIANGKPSEPALHPDHPEENGTI